MAVTFAEVIRSKYVQLTTFTKDGRPKPTPIRGAPVNGKLLVFTGSDSWKVRRLRRDPRIRVAACTFRGHPTSDSVPAVATLLDRAGTERVYGEICRQYGPVGWLYALFTKASGGLDKRVGIEVAPAADATGEADDDTDA